MQAAIDAYEKSGKMVDAALAYAAHGFPIFPLTADKKPIPARDRDANGKPVPNTGSFKKSTTDPIIIQKWWRNNPKALIGLPMGAASGVLCLDVDTIEDHADGLGAWNELAAQHPPIITREHRSATGGPHLIFIWDPEHPIRCGKGALPIGIEVKGQGGYIVVPPSRRKGRSYNVHRDIDPVTPPAWLTDRIWQGRSPSNSTYTTGDSVASDFDELAEALSCIPNPNLDWDEWIAMALRIFAATGGEGFELFDTFSQKCEDKYDPEATLERWEHIQNTSPPNRTGADKIFKIARENGWVRKTNPTYTTPTSDIDMARSKIKRIVRSMLEGPVRDPFFEQGLEEQQGLSLLPPAWAIWIDTGIGKTQITIRELAEWLRGEGIGKLVVYAVPRHRLGHEIEAQFTAHGIDARVFRGRGADDPEHPGSQMCLNRKAEQLAIACQADVTATCCKYKNMRCHFFDRCGYQRQMPDEQPEVWIVASDMLFHTQKVLGQPELIVIDESIWRKGGIGIEYGGFEWVVAIDGISNTTPGTIDFADPASELASLRHKLAQALRQQEHNGGVERQYLQLLDVETCTRAISLEWNIRPKIPLRPGMSEATIRQLANNHALIDAIGHSRRMIKIWEAVRELLSNYEIDISGRLTLEQNNGQRAVRWRGVAAISQQFQARTLLLDATLPDLEVLKIFHPQIEIVANIKVQMPPDVHIQQILGTPTSSRKLIENSKLKDGDRHLKEIRRYIIKRHLETGRHSTLVICQEKVEDWLMTGKLPGGVTCVHFNDISGLDEFKHVRLLILIGRTQPGPDAPEVLAGAFSGAQPIKVAPNAQGFAWYSSVKRGIRLADGSGIAVDRCDRHPDPFVEALRWLICEGELLQALGRARGVNRDAEHPLDVDILSNVVLPIIVNDVSYWKAPSLLFETAVGGVMLASPIDMVKLWPSIWPNRSAADRTLMADIPVLPSFEQVFYQPAGAKLNSRLAWFDRGIIPDPRRWLERHLGPLKSFR